MDQIQKRLVKCPECESNIEVIKNPQKGDIIECLTCGIESEIITTTPLTLAPLEEEK